MTSSWIERHCSSIVENVDVETRQLDFLVAIFHITFWKTFSIFLGRHKCFMCSLISMWFEILKSEITLQNTKPTNNTKKSTKITNRRKKNYIKTSKQNRFPIYVILINANSCGPSCQWIDFCFYFAHTATVLVKYLRVFHIDVQIKFTSDNRKETN